MHLASTFGIKILVTFIDVFLEGRLFPIHGFMNDTLMHPGDKDRNAIYGARDEQADEWTDW